MRRSKALQGVRVIKFTSILGRYEAAELNQIEVAELLGIDERTFRRWRQRFEDDGEAGLLDRRLGKASGRRVPLDREHEVEALYRERYSGFTAKHFHEQLVARHNFAWSYTWTKTFLHSKGLLEKAERRGAHRRKRPRRPMPGMMLHQDGSRHIWVQGLPALDLIVTMDDATSAIYSAFLCEEEGTASTFRALREVFSEHGLPLSLYTDRGSHYFHTDKADGPVDRKRPTQVGRALERLGVEHIAAYSPQAPLRQAQQTFGAPVPDLAGPSGQGTGAGRDRDGGGGQRLLSAGPHSRPQRVVRGSPQATGNGVRGDPRRRSRRGALRAGGAPAWQRQPRLLQPAEAANP